MRRLVSILIVASAIAGAYSGIAAARGADVSKSHDSASPAVRTPPMPQASVSPSRTPNQRHAALLTGLHHIVVRDAHGQVVKVDDSPNLVTTGGKNYLLNAGLANGASEITSWFVGSIAENRHVGDGYMGGGDWQASHSYSQNTSLIVPTTNNAGGYSFLETGANCSSGASRPGTFSQTPGNTTTDNTCTWTNEGLNALCSPTVSWVSGDNGRNVTILGAGASGANLSTTVNGTPLNGACAQMNNAASTAVSAAVISVGPLLAAADTAASHSGWTESLSSNFTNASRPAWTAGTVGAGSVNNSGSAAVYTMASSISTVYLHGIFLISTNTLGGTSGTLYSEAEFSSGALAVGASYTVTDTYTLSLTKLERGFEALVDALYGRSA